MKTTILRSLNRVSVILLLTAAATWTYAQKLPSVQNEGFYVPAGLKIDGHATEWKKFEAFNKANNIYYSIANDDSNLYLVVQTVDTHAMEKILAGGLTFTLKNTDKKNAGTDVAITYPILDPKDRFALVPKIKKDDDTKYVKDEVNALFIIAAKEIEVKGISAVADTLLSIYNDAGINAAATFGDPKAFTYELKIPLKYLKGKVDLAKSFGYNIKLNTPRIKHTTAPGGPMVVSVMSVRRGSKAADDMQDLQSATDFSGTYMLAKK